jgi:hypothetical protein
MSSEKRWIILTPEATRSSNARCRSPTSIARGARRMLTEDQVTSPYPRHPNPSDQPRPTLQKTKQKRLG